MKSIREKQREYWDKFRKDTMGMSPARFIAYVMRGYENAQKPPNNMIPLSKTGKNT